MVINKPDRGKADLRLPEQDLRRTYPQSVDIVRTSCEPDDFARRSIEDLRDLIARTVSEHSELKHVHDPIPLSWLRVKERIAALAAKAHVFETSTFASVRAPAGRA